MIRKQFGSLLLVMALVLAGCRSDTYGTDDGAPDPQGTEQVPVQTAAAVEATAYGGTDTLASEDLERDRYDDSWRRAAEQDTRTLSMRPDTNRASEADTTSRMEASTPTRKLFIYTSENDEAWDDITPESVNSDSIHLPLSGKVEGPSVLRVQLLLDQVHFSPGIIDGRWGKNTEKAVYWLQKREGIDATGTVDSTTFHRMMKLAGNPDTFIMEHTLTDEDVAGPFVEIPDDIYEKAKLDRMGYQSLTEKLSEEYHATPDLLKKINPDITLDSLQAGEVVMVPDVSSPDGSGMGEVARVVVSGEGFYVHAEDADGRILYHFPSTLGSSYDPSPEGDLEINSVTEDPWWHYQPDILANVPDDQEDARIPPGPNNAVGAVWIDLSKPHYGIHGTSAPETIGYVTSAGCVRLTNWDARFLGRQLEAGTPVQFTGTRTDSSDS